MILWRRHISVKYEHGPTVDVVSGPSLLQISLADKIPHDTRCGGRGQCGACLVQVLSDPAHLPARNRIEKRFARVHDLAPDQRLACQLHPRRDLVVKVLGGYGATWQQD